MGEGLGGRRKLAETIEYRFVDYRLPINVYRLTITDYRLSISHFSYCICKAK